MSNNARKVAAGAFGAVALAGTAMIPVDVETQGAYARTYLKNEGTAEQVEVAEMVYRHGGKTFTEEISLATYRSFGSSNATPISQKRKVFKQSLGRSLIKEAQAAIVDDSRTTHNTTSGDTSVTFSHTTSAGSDRAMFVVVAYNDGLGSSVSSVTYNGTSLTEAEEILCPACNSIGAAGYYSTTEPSSGANNVVVTYGSTMDDAQIVVQTLENVDQANELDTSNSANGTNGSPNVSTSVSDGAYMLSSLSSEQTDTVKISARGSATIIQADDWGLDVAVSAEQFAISAGSHTSGFVDTDADEAYGFVVLYARPATAGGGGSTPAQSVIWFD